MASGHEGVAGALSRGLSAGCGRGRVLAATVTLPFLAVLAVTVARHLR
jgi:hypothetical protein